MYLYLCLKLFNKLNMLYNFYWPSEPFLLTYMLMLPGYLVSVKLVIIFLNF